MNNPTKTGAITLEGYGGFISQGFGGVISREGFGGGRPEGHVG